MGNVFRCRECVTIDTYHNIPPDPHPTVTPLYICVSEDGQVPCKSSWSCREIIRE